MSLVELQAEINKEFNTDMPLIQLFENSTLGAMARQIDPATGFLWKADAQNTERQRYSV